MQGRIASFLLFSLLAASCSERQLYEEIQHTRKSHCYQLATDQRQRCLEELQTVGYDEYQRELKKVQNAN